MPNGRACRIRCAIGISYTDRVNPRTFIAGLLVLVEQGTISPSADGNWGFVPMPGTTVLFDTGPKAEAYLDQVPGLTIEPAGDGPDGFARYRIAL